MSPTIFDVPRSTLSVSSPVRSFAASVTGKGGVSRERVPGVTHKGNRGRGATSRSRGVTVRDRRFSGARHFQLRLRLYSRVTRNGRSPPKYLRHFNFVQYREHWRIHGVCWFTPPPSPTQSLYFFKQIKNMYKTKQKQKKGRAIREEQFFNSFLCLIFIFI